MTALLPPAAAAAVDSVVFTCFLYICFCSAIPDRASPRAGLTWIPRLRLEETGSKKKRGKINIADEEMV